MSYPPRVPKARPTTDEGDDAIDLRDEVLALRRRAEASESAFAAIVQRSSDGVLVLDEKGVVRFANPAAAALLARPQVELVGTDVGFAVLAGDVSEVELVRRGAERVFAELRVVDTVWERRPSLLVLLRDVTERHDAEVVLAERATHDQLTGLSNRFLLEDHLHLALDRLARQRGSVTLFVADLDDFKSVNDRWGHAAGDQVLVEAARRLRSVLRPADSIARFGGDEFVLLCEGLDRSAANELTARLTASFREPFRVDGDLCTLGLSVGFVQAESPGVTAEQLLAAADQQMYRHKRRPRLVTTGRPVAEAPRETLATAKRAGGAVTAQYQFTLYVSGTGERSTAARDDLGRLCEQHLPAGAYDIRAVDVLEAVEEADAARILVTPTLIRTEPPPVLRVIGDLSGTSRLAEALGLSDGRQPHA